METALVHLGRYELLNVDQAGAQPPHLGDASPPRSVQVSGPTRQFLGKVVSSGLDCLRCCGILLLFLPFLPIAIDGPGPSRYNAGLRHDEPACLTLREAFERTAH